MGKGGKRTCCTQHRGEASTKASPLIGSIAEKPPGTGAFFVAFNIASFSG